MEVKLNNLSMDFEYAVQTQSNRTQNAEPAKEETQPREQLKEKNDRDIQNLVAATKEMTQWIQTLNTDIQFTLHEGTERLMVQVVDTKEHKVLKEFPPSDFLDTIAKIQEYVGILLDKKI